ncbi:MAG: MBL fold metallo-hydrolase, partial [Chloroflexota bacterium]
SAVFDESSWKAQESPLLQVTQDIWQVRLPLPYALDHVNVYLIQGETGWTIVDAGLNISKARATWEFAFDELAIGQDQVEKIVLTHMHPDHFGLAGWLQRRFSLSDIQVPVYASAEELAMYAGLWQVLDRSERIELTMDGYFQACGIPREHAEAVTAGTLRTGSKTLPHPEFTPFPDGGILKMGNRTWQMIHAPGHADGQFVFYDPNDALFLSGDQLLMKITPNIGYWSDTQPGVLKRYLDSLLTLKQFDTRLGLPGHKWQIADWQARIEEMLVHHEDRLNHTLTAVVKSPGITVNEVSKIVFRLGDLDIHQSRFAVAETLAHLDHLELKGSIDKETEEGVWHYTA